MKKSIKILPNDVARCVGVQYDGIWREGCENCLRRLDIGKKGEVFTFIEPPVLIVFFCEFLIEKGDNGY